MRSGSRHRGGPPDALPGPRRGAWRPGAARWSSSSTRARCPSRRPRLEARGFGSVVPAATVTAQAGPGSRRLEPEAVVIDSYRLPPVAYAAARASYRTLAVVDGAIGGREADVYLDQNIGAEHDHRSLPAGAVRLAGLRYALMRDEVLRHRPAQPEVPAPDGPARVLAFFGGTDAFGAAPVLTAALAATGQPFRLSVVAASAERRAALEAIATAPGQEVEVIAPTDRIAEPGARGRPRRQRGRHVELGACCASVRRPPSSASRTTRRSPTAGSWRRG
ncbi:hypothetical protein [Nocardioides convexus]|uniref:hypothetical protein n=1 Tax=Nocardioides convexus TaxID=2712224 RepID=UPI0024186B1E|nr:hypothetical protein [Nocardioides convexus]